MKRLVAAAVVAFAVTGAAGGTAVAQQAGVTPGAFCAPQGASGTTSAGTAVVCSLQAGETQPRWRDPSGTVTAVSGVVTSTQPQPLAGTGVLSVRVAAFGVLLVAMGWVFVSAVRPRWRRRLAACPESVLGAWRGPRFRDRRTSADR